MLLLQNEESLHHHRLFLRGLAAVVRQALGFPPDILAVMRRFVDEHVDVLADQRLEELGVPPEVVQGAALGLHVLFDELFVEAQHAVLVPRGCRHLGRSHRGL